MSRLPTYQEMRDALRNSRKNRIDRAVSLALDGWSHGLCMGYASFQASAHHAADAVVAAYLDSQDLYALGIQPPISNPPSGRRRREPCRVPEFWRRYQET